MKKAFPFLSKKGITAILLLISMASSGQEVKPDSTGYKKDNNAIYGNLGIGGMWFTATAYYERMFTINAEKSTVSGFLQGGYGGVAYWANSSPYILGRFVILTGVKKHHLEASAGIVKFLGDYLEKPTLSGAIGYRMQKPDGHFIYRMGGGFPEGFYIGIGICF